MGDRTSQETWHRRIGQRSLSPESTTKIKQLVTGFDMQETQPEAGSICEICMEGKQTRDTFTGERMRCEEILHTIHTDICSPMPVEGLMGERYFVTFIDEMSGRMAITLLKQKSEVFERFKEYQARVERETGKKIKELRSDGGGEYTGQLFQKYLAERGITQKIVPPYTPRYNGRAQQANRTIMEMVRCMLFDARLEQKFWGYAALTPVHIINQLPRSTHANKTPFDLWFKVQPSFNHLRVFGCSAYRHIPAPNRRKLDHRGQKCQLIEYEEQSGSRVYTVYDKKTGQVLVIRDIVFDEKQKENIQENTIEPMVQPENDLEATGNLADKGNPTYTRSNSWGITVSSMEGEDLGKGDPLPPIDPADSETPVNLYDEETIMVRRPQSAVEMTAAAAEMPASVPILR